MTRITNNEDEMDEAEDMILKIHEQKEEIKLREGYWRRQDD